MESQRPSLMIKDEDEVVRLITANGGRIQSIPGFRVPERPRETKYR